MLHGRQEGRGQTVGVNSTPPLVSRRNWTRVRAVSSAWLNPNPEGSTSLFRPLSETPKSGLRQGQSMPWHPALTSLSSCLFSLTWEFPGPRVRNFLPADFPRSQTVTQVEVYLPFLDKQRRVGNVTPPLVPGGKLAFLILSDSLCSSIRIS